jgi:hypothetical protein
MDSDLAKLLGPGAITVILTLIIQFVLKMRENKHARAIGIDAAYIGRSKDDARWVAAYRHNAEAHVDWDQDMRQGQLNLQYAVHRLEERIGEPLTQFPPIPKAPPLFPALDDDSVH